MSTPAATAPVRTDWSLIWAERGFRYFFFAMFISLFGSGMNFAGVSWHILALTHSTVKVSYQVIVATAPGLLIPFIGGVLIDRYDRRILGILLDFARGIAVLSVAYIAWRGHLGLWHLYLITFITGTGSAMYWANVNSLVQEVMPASQFTGANAAVLVGVQTGMLFAGALVGFIYDGAGIAGILGIDGLTYFVSAWCLYKVRSGYVSPRQHLTKYPREFSATTEAIAEGLETGETPEVAEAGLSLAVYSDLREGVAYLREQPTVRALGITHSILMAGVVSANILLVALAKDILHSGPRGFGYLEGGWGLGAIIGGLLASQLPQRSRMILYAVSLAGLALGHLAMPFITFLVAAVFFQVSFGFFRALSGVVAQAALMRIVPRHFMGRTQSAMAVLTTVLQLLMSFALGWISQRLSIFAGFSLLALIYALGALSAFHARSLLHLENSWPQPNLIASSGKVWQNIFSVPQRPPMKLSTRQQGDATILDLIGEITLLNSPEIRKAVLGLLREQRVPHLIVNMQGVPYVDSSGVASLVEGLKLAREVKSRFALYGLSKSAKTVLELTHLLRIFEVHITEQEALESPPPPIAGSAKTTLENA